MFYSSSHGEGACLTASLPIDANRGRGGGSKGGQTRPSLDHLGCCQSKKTRRRYPGVSSHSQTRVFQRRCQPTPTPERDWGGGGARGGTSLTPISVTASKKNENEKKKTVPWCFSSRSERRVLQYLGQPTPTPTEGGGYVGGKGGHKPISLAYATVGI